jgi:hypothetical protein
MAGLIAERLPNVRMGPERLLLVDQGDSSKRLVESGIALRRPAAALLVRSRVMTRPVSG